MKNVVRAVIFWGIFVFLCTLTAKILMPKWYYPNMDVVEGSGRIMPGYYDESPNTISVLFAGTSHVTYGISPLELYELYGFTSYNAATPTQPLQVSYYVLKEAIKTQDIKVFCLDASSSFIDDFNPASWKYVMDTMKYSIDKLHFSMEYASFFQKDLVDGLSSIYAYHSRWNKLKKEDFTDFFRNKKYYSKGYHLTSQQYSGITIEDMNNWAIELQTLQDFNTHKYYYGKEIEFETSEPIYNPIISEENTRWLLKIKELCDKNNIMFLLFKVPTINNPIVYPSAWTEIRSKIMKEFCVNNNLQFLDLIYDVEDLIDLTKDFTDGGSHLNYLGAKKISLYMGKYILDHYNVEPVQLADWNNDMKIYNKIIDVLYLQLENNFDAYLKKLQTTFSNNIVFITASGDAFENITTQSFYLLSELGIKSDLANLYGKSFLAIIESGDVIYEANTNKKLIYGSENKTYNFTYNVTSFGKYAGAKASIQINGQEYAINQPGLNIVVYDAQKDCVIDSVCFNIGNQSDSQIAARDYSQKLEFIKKYESYLIENEVY